MELIKASTSETASQRQRATNLFQHAVKRLWAADVKADKDGIRIRVGERPHVVVVRRPCMERRGEERKRKLFRQIYFGSM